jgi:Rod binding domain-containing protein
MTLVAIQPFEISSIKPGVPAPPPRLVHAAHEFEAQMMQELMKPLNHDTSLTGGDEDGDDSGSQGALGEFASEALGRAMSEHGGFGIAASIVKELSASGNQHNAPPVTGLKHLNTVAEPLQ